MSFRDWFVSQSPRYWSTGGVIRNSLLAELEGKVSNLIKGGHRDCITLSSSEIVSV